MKLSVEHKRLLRALAAGHKLKVHRDIEGRKEFRLHDHAGHPPERLAWRCAQELAEAGLIDSNKKFPAATFWLTEQGQVLVQQLARDTWP